MDESINKIAKYLLLFLAIFIPFRELIALYTSSFVKFIPDVLIWVFLLIILIKNKFKLNLKVYDYLYIGFIIVGFISCFINSVSFLAFALQVRSIGTMYVLFYILRNIKLNKNDYKKIISTLMFTSIVIMLFAVVEYFFDKTVLFPSVWANSIIYESNFARTYSLMNNPNTFSIFIFMVMYLVYSVNKDSFQKRYFIYYALCFLCIILSASRSTILAVALFFIFLIYESLKSKSFYNLIHMVIIFAVSFGFTYGFELIKDSAFTKLQSNTNQSTTTIDQNNSNVENEENEDKPLVNMAIIDRWKETTSGTTTDNSNVNGRLFIIKTGLKIFKDKPIFGTGFGTYGSAASRMVTPKIYEKYNLYEGFYSDNEYIKIVVETGIIGTIIYGMFILSLLYEFFKQKQIKKIFIFLVFLFIGMFYNVFELQILCFILYLSFVVLEEDYFKKKIKDKKVGILSLHLGFGGVEQVVANTANMLSDKYEVEIISLYKNKEEIPFKINKNVKIVYLTNFISNRKEFNDALKNKRIFRILKEGIKAIYILLTKDFYIRRYIQESDAKIIISTRYSFSKILNYNGRKETYKIHQEHTYSVNDEYIKNLNKLKKLDYIIPVSKALYEAYENKIKIKLKCIPNALNYFPKENELSKLNTKNLIAIGRLEPEKGFSDLLSIISKLRDKDVFLNLFGDGSQLNILKEKAKELKIESRVKFWGFKNQEFIKKYLNEATLYVMTSYEESFGLVLIEAMSYGVPCIAYDSAEGTKNIITSDNGYFIKNRNEKKMVDTINKYLDVSNKEKKVIGKNARITSEQYKYDNIKEEWLEFISNILEVK